MLLSWICILMTLKNIISFCRKKAGTYRYNLVYSTDCLSSCTLSFCIHSIGSLDFAPEGKHSCCVSISRGTIKCKTPLPDGACERHLSDIYPVCVGGASFRRSLCYPLLVNSYVKYLCEVRNPMKNRAICILLLSVC